ncbi:protein kinase domain-containing protein [Amycolatopsis sp. cmx-4-68]|uniref:protein kinase domain-containing protein n=1 Tax=Amycolatopsis sp. cmx-4-68 TaxID=2790938 RepID=UPI00397A0EAD
MLTVPEDHRLINSYGQLHGQHLSMVERDEQLLALMRDLLARGEPTFVAATSAKLTGSRRQQFAMDGRRYVLEVAWPDRPVSSEVTGEFLTRADRAPADQRHVLVCMSGIEQGAVPDVSTAGLLLDRVHVEAMVCGLIKPVELLNLAFSRAYVDERPFVSLTDLLVDQSQPEPPARMFRPDQLPPPWEVIQATGAGVAADVVQVGDAGWARPLGLSVLGGSGMLLVTTEEGVLELDPARGTTFWSLRLAGCHGAPLVLPDQSYLVMYHGTVVRYLDGEVEPLAGGFTASSMLLAGSDGEPWVLSGSGGSSRDAGGDLALTRLGQRVGEQHRFDVEFPAAVRAAGWLERRRFFLAAGGHSAVVDLSRSTIVNDVDWIAASHHYPGHLLVVDPNRVITASPDGSGIRVMLQATDISERSHATVAELAVNSIYGLASVGDDHAYVLADVRGNETLPAPILIRLSGWPPRATDEPKLSAVLHGDEKSDLFARYRRIQDSAKGQRRDYRLDPRPIDDGAQAHVFGATHKETEVRVAFKRLKTTNPAARARMKREIAVAQRLGGHLEVMPVLDHSDAYDWFVMPLADGTAETLLHVDQLSNPSPLRSMISSICAALRAAHDLGYLHRDIKPSNVLKVDDRWILADWGLVRHPRGQTTNPDRTRSGVLLGTEGFAAPELSSNAHTAGPPADVYSVGQMIGWAVLGRWPRANIPLVPPDGPWHDIVAAATHSDPDLRPATVDALLALIEEEFGR